MVIRANRTKGKTITWYKALSYIGRLTNKLAVTSADEIEKEKNRINDFEWINRLKSVKKNKKEVPTLSEINENILDTFYYAPHEDWLNDNISREALSRYEIGYYGLIDLQMANLGDIQSRRYKTAAQILDDLDSYLEDYIISPLLDCLDEVSLDPQNPISNSFWGELLKYKNLVPENEWDFNVLDMICNHFEEINLENCTYEEVK